jgi:hypothetical protein
MAVTWDYSVLPFQSIEITRRNLSRSGGLTIFGTEQVVQSSSDFWAANVTLKVRKREQILAYRALQAQSLWSGHGVADSRANFGWHLCSNKICGSELS